ncbi:MAG: RluA family pseudouridine synthase, partial [Planctomycetota bacterium]|nr:RluA family pseudouridine synthase [Planctomycetota bacterium]
RGPTGPAPEPIALDLLYEDECIAVVNKPYGMVVHPAKGHWSGTLAAALSHHFTQLSSVGGATRPGIVHRLDRDTSGVILVAKTDTAHTKIAAQFEARTVSKEYCALVSPSPDRDRDWINAPIGPHPYQREKMAIRPDVASAREAQTFYEVTERFRGISYLKVKPKTGRTHQIRVHLTHAGYPILADKLYSGRSRIVRGDISGLREDTTVLLNRQALHAHRLEIEHPASGERMEFVSPLPEDFSKCLAEIRKYRTLR